MKKGNTYLAITQFGAFHKVSARPVTHCVATRDGGRFFATERAANRELRYLGRLHRQAVMVPVRVLRPLEQVAVEMYEKIMLHSSHLEWNEHYQVWACEFCGCQSRGANDRPVHTEYCLWSEFELIVQPRFAEALAMQMKRNRAEAEKDRG